MTGLRPSSSTWTSTISAEGALALDLELTGKVAVVTGATRGIGRAIAGALAAEGCAVGICARDAQAVRASVDGLTARGHAAFGAVADVTRPGDVERFVAEAAVALGGIDLAVACAGGSVGGRFASSTAQEWTDTFELNVGHAARLIRAALPHMRSAGGGSVVIISSISGWKPAPRPQYGVAKAAEIYLAAELARELAPDRVRVNTVSPGSILVPGGGWDETRSRDPERFGDFLERDLPWGRLGTPEEVADVVSFLLSARASWITGAHVPVDGAQGRPTMSAWS